MSGWLLAPLVITYIITGFALCNRYGLGDFLDQRVSADLHRRLAWTLIALAAVHVVGAAYLAIRRWGWIGKRNSR